ncbi:hypothetical protein NSQ91_06970 [Paenibacillus sp. FSL R7-0048]|uniref:hypothetical protein n=1 Tax=Paenibacillus TaxID=44249 RepID=UPI00096DD0EA|nr:hypothetical protein [Paenibacillus odorifer]OMD58442.1 hypothetical protein BSK48_30565 [Paenibacillus odorifer]
MIVLLKQSFLIIIWNKIIRYPQYQSKRYTVPKILLKGNNKVKVQSTTVRPKNVKASMDSSNSSNKLRAEVNSQRNSTKGTGNAIISDGRVSIDAIKANPSAFNGKSADDIAQMLRNQGYDVTVQVSTKSRSGAQIIKINNSGGGKNITQVQVSPGGGRHGDSPYVKISTSDQGIIKIVNGAESVYKTDGKEAATIIFTGR